MEPEVSLPCSQEPSTGPYSEPDQSNPYHPILSEIHFNIVHPNCLKHMQFSGLYLQRNYKALAFNVRLLKVTHVGRNIEAVK
jgi:hypothetical protein